MKNLWIIFVLCNCFANAQNTDSLIKAAYNLPIADTNRIDFLTTAAWDLQYQNIDMALELTQKCLTESKNTNSVKGIYKSLVTLGTLYQTSGNFNESEKYFKEAINICAVNEKFKWLSTCYNNLANTYNLSGKTIAAIESYEKSIELKKKYDNGKLIGITYANIGSLYYHLEDSVTAMKKFKLGLLDTKLEDNTKLSLLCNIANLYGAFGGKDSADKYLQLLQICFSKIANPTADDEMLYIESILEYERLFEKSNADFKLSNKAIALAKESNNENRISGFYRLRMKKFENLNNIDSAIYYGEASIALATKLKQFFYLKDDYKTLATYYEQKGNFPRALTLMKLQSASTDSVFNIQAAEASINAEAKYNNKQKEERNILLEKERKAQEKLKQLYLLLGAITSLLLALIAYFIYKSKIKTEKLNKEISKQSNILEQSNIYKTKLLSIISHDVRAPINGLQNLLQLKKMQVLAPDKEAELDIVMENDLLNTAYALDNLLHWSVDELNISSVPKPTQFKIANILNEQINLLLPLANAKKVQIKQMGNADLIIHSDENILSLIIRNILNNAIKFSNTGGVINIGAKEIQNKISIQIQDFGTGMDADKIMQLGKQLNTNNAGTLKEKGVGLGHVLINEYSKKINAKIELDSKIGEGTTVSILL